jgi:hypothetical protein
MKIVFEYPPNIEDIKKKFVLRPTVIFTYGDTIYNPGRGIITKDLMVHEETHQRQQGIDPAGWWMLYLNDPQFRLSQEVEAYQNQYQYFIKYNHGRNEIFLFVLKIARDLSSSLYGNVVEYHEAVKLIKNEKTN